MPDLLLELFSEEIPARMQRKAASDLQKLVTDVLVERGLTYEGAKAFATPRRLALTVHGLPQRSPDQKEETKGPPVAANEQAIAGFLRKTGLKSIAEAKIQKDPKKGDFYVAVVEKPGRDAIEVIAEILPPIIRNFPWPKQMRWGASSAKPGALTWVRPLHSIVCLFGPETSETEVVPFEIDGIRSGNVTYGHRFLAPEPITVRRFDDYMPKLEAARVVLDADRRKQMILADARDRALAVGLELVEDEALLEEVAGLVEWPVVLMGTFDEAFLEIPPEVIRTTIRVNQKCFVLRDHSGKLANRFVLVANTEASDGGAAIVAGNQRVIRARLSDARHFWKTDLADLPDYRDKAAKPLDQRLEKLKAQNIVFHEKLGTQGERVARIARLAKEIAPLVGADAAQEARSAGGATGIAEMAERAANLAKADLVTEMVGEFPELQGLMGKYYALAQGEDPSIATAIEDHYKPVGPNDRVPADPVAIAVALADKLDTLVGFWAIDEKPTGSKDPYALRRAALGIIRLVLDNDLHLSLLDILESAFWAMPFEAFDYMDPELASAWGNEYTRNSYAIPLCKGLFAFLTERLKVQLREQGARHDLVDAVLEIQAIDTAEASSAHPRRVIKGLTRPREMTLRRSHEGDLLLIVRRVEALGKFLDTEDGKSLLAGYKRAANILRDEEKKSGETYSGAVDAALLTDPAEKALAAALDVAVPAATAAVGKEDFAAAMTSLATLRVPVDAFFTDVRVNADDPKVRVNRLRLLNRIREATLAVADFAKIAG